MPSSRAYHSPVGRPCFCGVPLERHRVDHVFVGTDNICKTCELPHKNHRLRDARPDYRSRSRKGRRDPNRKSDAEATRYIGIDGEGIDGEGGRKDHKYVLLAASVEDGSDEWMVEANIGKRLTTEECLDLILELPTKRTKIFSFSFNYDITKMLTDLDNESLYMFWRPELRQRTGKSAIRGPYPVQWPKETPKYELNLTGTKFVVQSIETGKRVVIWDLFKFFQAKFVSALQDWKVGHEELWKRMSEMKDRRATFSAKEALEIRNYCLEETRCIGQLARKLVEAHDGAGLTLKTFYGAGSSGAAMLTAMGIRDKLAPGMPAMKHAVACAFSGGRFENSVIGAIREPLESWDISSAYVYQLAFLPCLEHGSWRHTTKRSEIERAEAQNGALVRYSLGESNASIGLHWGPFPFRTKDGTISFPTESGGGWVWLDEYIAGERLFPNVRFHEAWVYSSNCNCKPFGQIPEYYILRRKIGKEGPGLVIKLGMNSCYGKLAQSIGNAIFNSWIWAGMITSGCRAQLLHVMALHKEPRNLLMIATDGVLTREKIQPPKPLFTATDMMLPDAKGKMVSIPLGGWEHKDCPKGTFIARPGIYFPMNPTEEEIKQVRARGVGRSVVLKSHELILNAWETDGIKGVATVANVSRFCGGKTSISRSANGYRRAKGKRDDPQAPSYGQWISRKVGMTFDPMPKRAGIYEDGVSLIPRKFPRDLESVPYKRAMDSEESAELKRAAQELLEQPDCDYQEYDLEME